MDKQKYIKKLMNFIDDNDPSKHISYLARNDSFLKLKWEKAKSISERRKVTSAKKVIELIDVFENTVLNSSKDIKERSYDKGDMLIAQYSALQGLKIWCQKSNVILVLKDSSFPDLTEADVNEIIYRMTEIIKQI